MKTFRGYLSEEVKIGALASGGIEIERDAVRDEINGILSGIASAPCISPYGSLNKVRKALGYFHIHLPKKVYMEGRHGVEVWEVRQFGDRMGMTDQGEFIKSVPCKYYLFFHYHMIGSMYYFQAKIVDDVELESKISAVESMIKEDAATQQMAAKGFAPKEKAHTALDDCHCGPGESPSTKKAVSVSMRRKDKKLSAGTLPEGYASIGHAYDWAGDVNTKAKFYGNKPKATTTKGDEKDDTYKSSGKDKKVKFAKTVKEQSLDELKKETLKAYMSAAKADRKASKAVVKKGLDTEGKFKHIAKKRKQGIEKAKDRLEEGRMPPSVIKHKQKLASMTPEEKAKKFAGKSEEQLKAMAWRHGYGKDSNVYSKYIAKKLHEKAPPGAKFERMVKHIKAGYSKDGLTKKEKGIAYATAWKAKKREKTEE